MKTVRFVALPDPDGNRDGGNGWQVEVDGKIIIQSINDLDIGNNSFKKLWQALDINFKFDFD